MSTGEKFRPSSLVFSKDKSKSDMIMRIVSPITPQFVNSDMRDTLKISEVIRLQQNELIASGNYEKKFSRTPVSSNWADAPMKSASSSTDENESKPSAGASATSGNKEVASLRRSAGPDEAGSTVAQTVLTGESQSKHSDTKKGTQDMAQDYTGSYDSSPVDDTELSRIGGALSRKTLKRSNAPGPLRISPKAQAASMAPMINSAPMRSLYGAHPLRRAPVRYVYPAIGHLPQTAVHYLPTPIRLGPAMGPDRISKPRSPRAVSARRRKPVLDVFEGQVAKLAPMPSQPPSAQIEHFDVTHSDDEKATQEEMEEMEMKRKRATSALRGSISFNDESAFNFTIFQGNESNAKKKFLEVCETTWDKYMASSTGS